MSLPPVVPIEAVEIDRLQREIDTLAAFSDTPAPAITRILWTLVDREARVYLKQLFDAEGLVIREDALGNTFARWEGSRPELEPVVTGSHIDAIPHSGKYDGVVGVLGALEAFRALRRAGFTPIRSLEIVLFTAEEPTRFGLGCLGSRAMSGALTPAALHDLKDGDGVSLEDARADAGYDAPLETVRLPKGVYSAFVELHIEQGPLLEREGLPIGVVTAVAAPATLRVTLTGEGGHAGAVLMPDRRDALVAAAEVVQAVEMAAYGRSFVELSAPGHGAIDAVATTGVLRVHPGAVNSIPSRVEMEIDVRDIDLARRDAAVNTIRAAIGSIARHRKVKAEVEILNADPPAVCAPRIQGAAIVAAESLGLAVKPMVSRAYHDTLFMARIAPVGMIFIPCRGGVSHRPDEYSSPEEIARGVAVLAGTLAALSVQASETETAVA